MSSRTPIRSTQAFCLSKLTRRTNETLVDGTIARENYGIALPIGSALRRAVKSANPYPSRKYNAGQARRAAPDRHPTAASPRCASSNAFAMSAGIRPRSDSWRPASRAQRSSSGVAVRAVGW